MTVGIFRKNLRYSALEHGIEIEYGALRLFLDSDADPDIIGCYEETCKIFRNIPNLGRTVISA